MFIYFEEVKERPARGTEFCFAFRSIHLSVNRVFKRSGYFGSLFFSYPADAAAAQGGGGRGGGGEEEGDF